MTAWNIALMISVELLLVGPYPVKARLSMMKLAFSSAWGAVPAPQLGSSVVEDDKPLE